MPLPSVLETRPEMRAAELKIDGLSVLCFNTISGEPFWEVAYPRNQEHALNIIIHELDSNDEFVREIGPPVEGFRVDPGVRTIEIRLTNGSVDHFADFPNGGPADPNFNRKTSSDENDLGWMIDLADARNELLHGPVTLMGSDPSKPISLARIRHSLLCTLKPDEGPAKIAPRDANDPAAGIEIGRTNGEMVGVLLANDQGQIQFDFQPAGLTTIPPLDYSRDRRYLIMMINEDVEDQVVKNDRKSNREFVRGDLRLFYDHVIQVAHPKDLWAREKPGFTLTHGETHGDCHPTGFTGRTLRP